MGSITEAIVKMPDYFRNKGYEVYDSFISDFFSFSEKADLDNLERIIRPLLLKNKTDYKLFHADFLNFIKMVDCFVVSEEEANRLKKEKKERKSIERNIKSYSKTLEERKKRIEDFKEKISSLYTEKELKKIKKYYEKIKEEYKKITKDMHPRMKDFFNEVKPGCANKEEINEDLKEVLYKALYYDNYEDIFKYVELEKKHLEKVSKEKFDVEAEKRKIEEEEKERERLQKLLDEKASPIDTIIKEKPVLNHRKEFIGKNAIKSAFEGELFDKKISMLNEKDKRQIEEYIRENAKRFRTKLANKIKTGQKRRFDLPTTCKKACRTNGIPMDLQFTKPGKEKSKLIMFLDISGSCSSASKMLLTFMHQMKSVFTNGCETYVFVNSLYDVSSSFSESNSADEFIDMVFDTVPVKGVYSDYYRPLETFRKEYFSKLTKDSIVFFMGDARNNKNETGEEHIKAIARKAKKTYWLNTEERDKWDKADSIMSVYGQYMSEVSSIITVGDLLTFLTEVR